MTTVSLPSEDIGALVIDVGTFETRVGRLLFSFFLFFFFRWLLCWSSVSFWGFHCVLGYRNFANVSLSRLDSQERIHQNLYIRL